MSHISLLSSISATPKFATLDSNKSTIFTSNRSIRFEDQSYLRNTPLTTSESSCFNLQHHFYLVRSPLKRTKYRELECNSLSVARNFLKRKKNERIGHAYIQFTEVVNNLAVLVRSPSGKTLGSWRGGYFKYPRTSPNSLRSLVESVELALEKNDISNISFQYKGTGRKLYFALANKFIDDNEETKYYLKSVSLINTKPHNGPRLKSLRRT